MRIALYKGTSIVSRIIKFFTRSEYSHVAIILDNDKVIEAWNGTKDKLIFKRTKDLLTNLSTDHTPDTEVEIYELPIPIDVRVKAFDFYNAQVVKKYDLAGALGQPLFIIKTHDKNKWFCSELLVEGLIQGGLHRKDLDSSKVSPGDIPRLFSLAYVKTLRTI